MYEIVLKTKEVKNKAKKLQFKILKTWFASTEDRGSDDNLKNRFNKNGECETLIKLPENWNRFRAKVADSNDGSWRLSSQQSFNNSRFYN